MCSINSFSKFIDKWCEIEKEYGFSSTTYIKIFLEVAMHPHLTTGDITKAVGTSQPTMYRALNSFYEAGLGRKIQSMDDPRMYNFQLTDKGEELLNILKGE